MAALGAQQQGAAGAAWLGEMRTLPAIYAQEARRRRGAPAYGQMVLNSRDPEGYEDGPSLNGTR